MPEKGTIKALEDLRKSTTNFRLKTHVLYLIIKDDINYKTLEPYTQHLDVSISILRFCKTTYIQKGLAKLLTISNGRKRSAVVTPKIHKALKLKANDSENPLLSYHAVE